MTDPAEAIIVPPSANDTAERMAQFLKVNNDGMPHSVALESALAQVKTNLEARQLEDAKNATVGPGSEVKT